MRWWGNLLYQVEIWVPILGGEAVMRESGGGGGEEEEDEFIK